MGKLTQEEIKTASLVAGMTAAVFTGIMVWYLTHNLLLDWLAAFIVAPVMAIATRMFIESEVQE